MASSLQVTIFSTFLFVIFGLTSSAVSPLLQEQLKANDKATLGKSQEAPWLPATQPREFSYNIDDNIKGANQIRHETWNNGTVNGMYAYPLGGDEWQLVNYIADDKGFRVVSTKKVSESELMGVNGTPAKGSATVDINRDGNKFNYTVKADEIGQRSQSNGTKSAAESVDVRHQLDAQQKKEQEETEALKLLNSLDTANDASKKANATSSFQQQ